jgi:hypothetical protein
VQARHTMTLNGTTETGAEEWICPTCGRRMLLRWPPNYEKLVLEHGDDAVVHVGGKGGLRVGKAEVTPAAEPDVPAGEQQWLRDNGIDWGDASA